MSRALVSHIEIAAGLLLGLGQQCMNPVLRDGLEKPVWTTQSEVPGTCLAMSYRHADLAPPPTPSS